MFRNIYFIDNIKICESHGSTNPATIAYDKVAQSEISLEFKTLKEPNDQ